jgi:hypothetical protein
MSTFIIDSDNNITALTGLPTGGDESQSFSNAKELARLTAEWPVSRLLETWNSFAGVAPFDDLRPVKKFTSRQSAIARIWRAIARLSPDGARPIHPRKGEEASSHGQPTCPCEEECNGSCGQQEGGRHRVDEARQGRDPGRDRRSHGLAEAHGERLHQHSGQLGRTEK